MRSSVERRRGACPENLGWSGRSGRRAIQYQTALLCAALFNAGVGVTDAVAVDTVSAADVATGACAAMAARVDAETAAGPLLLRSYDGAAGSGPPDEPPLQSAACTYDNALAVIALLACDKPRQAQRIGSALRLAARTGPRLRNAYRAGSAADAPLANGWWDAQGKHWAEDPQQQGTATGNVAWAALALLDLYGATGQAEWRESARRLAAWIVEQTSDSRGVGGFTGGVEGDDAHARKVTWKSTEHNIDAAALFDRLAAFDGGEWRNHADAARRFLVSEWDTASGHFLVGTLVDGLSPNRATSGLDAQLWPLLLAHAPADWRRALAYAEREHRVEGGFDFNADRDGLWLEGTAQAALVYRVVGRAHDAQPLLDAIAKQFAPGGYVYATREPRITTGLALNADSASADFYYYRRPHLGATAWAALAALDRNPFESPRNTSKPDQSP